MKILTAILALGVSVGSFAGGKGHHKDFEKKFDKMSFEDAKGMMQDMSQKKIAMMNEFQSCVNTAKDKEALKQCKEDKWEDKKAMKKDMKSKYKQSQEESK